MKKIYLVGSLRNPGIPELGNKIRNLGYDVFDDWHAGGKEADDEWKRYEKERGRSYGEALKGHAAKHVFEFDEYHLDTSDVGILVLPAGKSGHLEIGYLCGQGKQTYVLFPDGEPDERWDVMYQFCTDVFFSVEDLLNALRA